MEVRIKKLVPEAVIPKYSKDGDAGLDLVATKAYDNYGNEIDFDNYLAYDYWPSQITYHTGISIEIPKGYVGLLFPRSSISKKDQTLSNSVGVIDSGYRGEIMMKYNLNASGMSLFNDNASDILELYKTGDKIGQLIIIPYPQIEFIESEELSDSERGDGGYGSTGN